MYLSHFSLSKLPFDLLPDPEFLYLGENHEPALTGLRYGVDSGAGFTIITGEIGAGKTTLIRRILHDLAVLSGRGTEYVIGLTSNTHKDFGSFDLHIGFSLRVQIYTIFYSHISFFLLLELFLL